MSNNDLSISDMEKFPSIYADVKDISLQSLNPSNDAYIHHDLPIIFSERKLGNSEMFLLKSIQLLQDVLICFQKKFTEYESFSEFSSADDFQIYSPKQWVELKFPEWEIEMPIFTEGVRKLYQMAYDLVRNMDQTVVRVSDENEKLKTQLKLEKVSSNKKGPVEIEKQKYKTMGSVYGSSDDVNNLEGLQKKNRKQETKIRDLKIEVRNLESTVTDMDAELEKCNKEIKKLNKQIKDANEEKETNLSDEIYELRVEMKNLHKLCQSNAEEKKEMTFVRRGSGNLDEKIDILLNILRDGRIQENFDKTIEEITTISKDIKELKRTRYQTSMGNASEEVEKLKNTIDDLEESINQKDKELSDLKEAFTSREEDCTKLRDQITGLLEGNNRSNDRDTMPSIMSKEISPNTEIDENDLDSLRKKIYEQDCLIIKKNEAMATMRSKFVESKARETVFEEEKNSLIEKNVQLEKELETCKSDLEKKTRAILTMKDKIKDLNTLKKSAEESEICKRKLDQSAAEIIRLKEVVTQLETTANMKTVECENLKKDQIRLQNEMNNMKKLNFEKKTENKQ